MRIYLSSPQSQVQAAALAGMPVLLSYAVVGCGRGRFSDHWLNKGYQQSFDRILIDSGAYSEFNTGNKVDLVEYSNWSQQWIGHADAIAGLDDIGGDWRQSLRNYEAFPGGFPTFHATDPPELLADLIAVCIQRRQWLGIGLHPARRVGQQRWLREVLDQIPESIHVHGWACCGYTMIRRFDSFDSTNWFRDAMKLKTLSDTRHLAYSECVEIVVKRYQRFARTIVEATDEPTLF